MTLGKLLGLQVKEDEIEEIKDIGEQGIPVVYKNLNMRIGSFEFPIKVGWALSDEVVPLLGREGLFNHFYITFKQNKGEIAFKKV